MALDSAKVVKRDSKSKVPLIAGQQSIKKFVRERVEPLTESEREACNRSESKYMIVHVCTYIYH